MCSLKQNECNSNWKVLELAWHPVLTADRSILVTVRQEAAERCTVGFVGLGTNSDE